MAYGSDHHDELPPGVHLPGPSPWPIFICIGMMITAYGAVFRAETNFTLFIVGLIWTIAGFGGWFHEDIENFWTLIRRSGGHVPDDHEHDELHTP